jgi:hypothetical protein
MLIALPFAGNLFFLSDRTAAINPAARRGK